MLLTNFSSDAEGSLCPGKKCKMPPNEEDNHQKRWAERNNHHPTRQGAHNECPGQTHTYLICWRGSFWRGLAAGSGLLCSRTAAFPAWLWKNTTLEKKIDFSNFFSIPLWLKRWNCSSQDGQIHEIGDRRLPKHSAMQRIWSYSTEFKEGFTTDLEAEQI